FSGFPGVPPVAQPSRRLPAEPGEPLLPPRRPTRWVRELVTRNGCPLPVDFVPPSSNIHCDVIFTDLPSCQVMARHAVPARALPQNAVRLLLCHPQPDMLVLLPR